MADIMYRKFTPEDIPGVVKVTHAVAEHDGEEGRMTEDMIRQMLQIPFIYPEEDFYVCLDTDDTIIGVTLGFLHPRTGKAQANYLLHPDCPEETYKPKMLELALSRVQARMNDVPEDITIYVDFPIKDGKTYDIDLLAGNDFEEVRRFYTMRIVLDEPVDAPDFPDGLEIRPYDSDQHLEAVHAAHQEAFRDHWGHSEDTPFDEWEKSVTARHTAPEKWWFVLWDVEKDEIAGYSLCMVDQAKDNMMDVDLLGVRRAWRKRGLGMALLRYSFHRFQQAGYTRASLGVDASSKTNAVALYERAGMHQHECLIVLRKILRGDPANIVE